MTSLASIEAEATLLVGRLSERRRRTLQHALVDLCVTHWHELRGPEPATPLAHGFWAATPPLADLCADLYATNDDRLHQVLQGHKPAQAFALLALEAIERADAEGARLAYEPMMLWETPAAGAIYAERVAAILHGKLEAPRLHPHASQPALVKALHLIVAHSGRYDLPALLHVLRMLPSAAEQDPALRQLGPALDELGIRFTALAGSRVYFTLHGRPRPPATLRRLGEILLGIRRDCMG